MTFDFSGLQIYLRPGKVPFATVPNIRLARQMSDNLFFKKVYERKSLVWRCWMRKSGYGIVRIFKQKFFPKLFRFIKELSSEVYNVLLCM